MHTVYTCGKLIGMYVDTFIIQEYIEAPGCNEMLGCRFCYMGLRIELLAVVESAHACVFIT